MRNRTTSTYTIEVTTDDPNPVADRLRDACPVTVMASGVDARRAFVRFRAADDAEAFEICGKIDPPIGAVLHTGYGVNQRTVAEQV